jgi:hypothetical protein
MDITNILWQVKFEVENIGQSHAFNVRFFSELEFTQSVNAPPIPELGHICSINNVLKADEQTPVYSGPIFWGEEGAAVSWSEVRMQSVKDTKTFLHLRGIVTYDDIFEEEHVTPFRYSWNVDTASSSWGEDPDSGWIERYHPGDPKAT